MNKKIIAHRNFHGLEKIREIKEKRRVIPFLISFG
jgi:hypothetical protein